MNNKNTLVLTDQEIIHYFKQQHLYLNNVPLEYEDKQESWKKYTTSVSYCICFFFFYPANQRKLKQANRFRALTAKKQAAHKKTMQGLTPN